MIKVFIVDDHEIMRTGLKKILSDEPDIKVVGEEENGTELLRIINTIECDIMLLDLNIPGRNGIELIEEIKRKKSNLKILVLSIYPENNSALPALNAGAAGYLSKDAALYELVNAIRKINEKGRYMSTNLAEQLAFNLLKENPENSDNLTSMEQNIAIMIANGKPAKIVAEELGLSTSTVFTHRRRIFDKLKIKNNVQLANYVIEHEMSNSLI